MVNFRGGGVIKSLILSFNAQKYEFCAKKLIITNLQFTISEVWLRCSSDSEGLSLTLCALQLYLLNYICRAASIRQNRDANSPPVCRGVHSIEAWPQPAACKNNGKEKHAYFHQSWGKRKIKLLKHAFTL